MKTKLLSACAFMMIASAAHGAQDAMTAKPMSAMSGSSAMSNDAMSNGMTKAKKSHMHHSKRAAKPKAAMHKTGKDAMSSSEMSH